MAGFVDVLLRGLALCGQAVAIGGVVFALLLLRPSLPEGGPAPSRLARSLALTTLGAAVVAGAQILSLAVQLLVLGDAASGVPIAEVAETSFFRAGLVRILACVGIVIGCLVLSKHPARPRWWIALTALTVLLGVGSAWTSHAAGRLGPRAVLLVLDALHQLAAGVWIGGLLHLTVLASSRRDSGWSTAFLKRFSAISFASVVALVVAGVGLTLAYVDGPGALLGTSYGSMILTKVVVLGGLVLLGAANFFAVRRLPAGADASLPRLRRFVEVEFGLGATVLFVAASLTSLPPAMDVVADRASLAEVGVRFASCSSWGSWPSRTRQAGPSGRVIGRWCSSGSPAFCSSATIPGPGRSARWASGRACGIPRCSSIDSSSCWSSPSASSSGWSGPTGSAFMGRRWSFRCSAPSGAHFSSRTRTPG